MSVPNIACAVLRSPRRHPATMTTIKDIIALQEELSKVQMSGSITKLSEQIMVQVRPSTSAPQGARGGEELGEREAPESALSVSLSLCLLVSVSLCLLVSVSLCLCVSVSLCLCVSVSLPLPLPLSLFLFLFLSRALLAPLSPPPFSAFVFVPGSLRLGETRRRPGARRVCRAPRECARAQPRVGRVPHLCPCLCKCLCLCLCVCWFLCPCLINVDDVQIIQKLREIGKLEVLYTLDGKQVGAPAAPPLALGQCAHGGALWPKNSRA